MPTADATRVERDAHLVERAKPGKDGRFRALGIKDWVDHGFRQGRALCCHWRHVEGATHRSRAETIEDDSDSSTSVERRPVAFGSSNLEQNRSSRL